MAEDSNRKFALELLGILHGGKPKTQVKKENQEFDSSKESSNLGGIFKRDCLGARYNMFQLVDATVTREQDGLVLKSLAYGTPNRPVANWVRDNNPQIYESLEQRNLELVKLMIKNRQTLPENHPDTYQVGCSSIILLGDQTKSSLIIFGGMSSESTSSWKSGRTNSDNYIVFDFPNSDGVDVFLKAIDLNAKEYSEGTTGNYKAMLDAIKSVFPEQLTRFADSHMFHRQEIQQIVDLRKSKTGEESPFKLTESQENKVEPKTLEQMFRESTIAASYNVFQMVDCQIKRDGDKLIADGVPIYGASADSHRGVQSWVTRNVSVRIFEDLEKRRYELSREQSNRARAFNFETSKGDYYQVGSGLVVVADRKSDNSKLLIFYGAISAEVAGTWTGGRTNDFNSVMFVLKDEAVVNEFLKRLNTKAKGWENETKTNYNVILDAIKGVFPNAAIGLAQSHMFHRQEIQNVVDLRKK